MKEKITKAEMKQRFADAENLVDFQSNPVYRKLYEAAEQALEHVPDDAPTENGVYSVGMNGIYRDVLIAEGVAYWVELYSDPVSDNEKPKIKWGEQILRPMEEK